MPTFTIRIDEKKCNNCGLCVKDCISGCLIFKNDKPVPANPEWCSLCSHCIAICPKDAITHSRLNGMESKSISKDKFDPEVYKKIITSRRSIRRYKDKAVPEKIIEEILKVASYSPTASNEMGVGYTVVTDKELIRNTGLTIFRKFERLMIIFKKQPISFIISLLNLLFPEKSINRYLDRQEFFSGWVKNGRDVITHDAPVLILIHGSKNSKFARENSAIAACNITNYAHAMGLGTCYIGFIAVLPEGMKRKIKGLKVPEGRKIYTALILGYPDHKYKKTTIRPEPSIDWVSK